MLIHEVLAMRGYSAAASDNGSDNGGAGKDDKQDDRGDDYVPSEDDEQEDDAGKSKDKDDEDEIVEGDDETKVKDDKTKAKTDEKDDSKKADDKTKAKTDEKADEKDKGKKPEPKIPKSRFDEAVGKERKAREAAEAKLAELTKAEGTPQKINDEIEELETELDKAIADNDPAKIKSVRKQIREKNAALVEIRAATHAQKATAMAVEKVRYDALVKSLEADYPMINPDSDEYDEDVAAEVIDLKEAYEAKGNSSADALEKAAKLLLTGREKKPAKADEKDDEQEDEAAKKIKAAEEAAAKRKEEAIKKATAATGKQPADMKDTGKDSDKKGGGFEGNVAKLSDDDFDKLPDDTKKRLRGDSL